MEINYKCRCGCHWNYVLFPSQREGALQYVAFLKPIYIQSHNYLFYYIQQKRCLSKIAQFVFIYFFTVKMYLFFFLINKIVATEYKQYC